MPAVSNKLFMAERGGPEELGEAFVNIANIREATRMQTRPN